ncbi:hypothetical protein MKY20_28480 [Cytobacillus sp. FSL W8-0315]
MEIFDTLTLIVDLLNFVTSEEGTNVFILPVRYIGNKKEKN